LIFILIGLQLPEILDHLSGQSLSRLCWQAGIINLVLVVVRVAWIFASDHLPILFNQWRARPTPPSNWRHTAIIAWTGMRGGDSLAAAMALPLVIANGSPFPGRDQILFFTFAVILVTLVLQGLSLPFVIRWLRVVDDGAIEKEEQQARLRTVQAALARLTEFQGNSNPRVLARLRDEFENRMADLESTAKGEGHSLTNDSATAYEQLLSEALLAGRRAILQLRDEKVINDEVLRHVQRDLDLAELGLKRR
jgi:CPA1 family monovalent cation:H+ antiporter